MNPRAVAALLVLCTAMAVPPAVQAQGVFMRGVRSCGEWVRDRDISDKSWLLGFLSGLAIGYQLNAIQGTDNESIYLWMDKYCRDKPLDNIADGSALLLAELAKRKGLTK